MRKNLAPSSMNTHLAVLSTSLALLATAPAAVVISEFLPNPPGVDPTSQTIELSGNPNEAYSGFLSTIEMDSNVAIGTIDRQTMIAGNLNANGFFAVDISDLENPSFTLLFHSADGGGTGTDLDTADDGTLDSIVSLGTIFDAISIPDTGADVSTYGVQLGGQDFSFGASATGVAFRDGNTGAWLSSNDSGSGVRALNGDDAGFVGDFTTPTFGTANPAIPEPSSALLGLLGMMFALVLRRR